MTTESVDQSSAPDPLFGAGITYNMGHSRHDVEYLTSTMRDVLTALPRLVAVCLRLSLRSDRRATIVVVASQLTLGATTAFGLLATNGVLRALLAQGPSPARVKAALPAIIMVCVAGCLTSLLNAASNRAQGVLQPKVEALATTELLAVSVDVELIDFQQAEYHNVLDAGQWGAAWADNLLSYVISAVNSMMSLIAAFGVLTILNPLLLPLLPIAVAPRAWSTVARVRRRNASRHSWLPKTRQMRQLVNEITNKGTAVEIRGHNAGAFLLPNYRRLSDEYMTEQYRLARGDARAALIADSFYGLSLVAIYGLLALMFWHGWVPLSTAGAAAYAVKTGTSQISSMVRMFTYIFEYGLYLGDWQSALNLSKKKAIRGGTTPVGPPEKITAENVTFTYPGSATPALSDVNVSITRGEVVALVGANGSGKSTLALLLAGLFLPESGQVCWDGVPTTEADRAGLMSQVAILSQNFPRWGFTLRANVAIGRHQVAPTEDSLAEAVAAAGAAELVEQFPLRWDALLATDQLGGVDLSGGQWQKVGLARMFYRDAPVLVMDEPTAALDPAAEAETFEKVRQLAGGRTVLLITHRLNSTRHADRIYVLDHGQVIEHGTHNELMAAGRDYSRLYSMQAAQFGIEIQN